MRDTGYAVPLQSLFFVNKRYIKDKTLSSAAEQAFKGMLPIGKFGFMVLNIDINPDIIGSDSRYEYRNKITYQCNNKLGLVSINNYVINKSILHI